MRTLPFFKPKKGIQFAGEGVSSGGGGGGVDYSTTEQNTGLKYNNKPIYQLTIVTNTWSQSIDISAYNIGLVFRFDAISSFDNYRIPNGTWWDTTENYLNVNINGGYLIVSTSLSDVERPLVITMEYTKTTD